MLTRFTQYIYIYMYILGPAGRHRQRHTRQTRQRRRLANTRIRARVRLLQLAFLLQTICTVYVETLSAELLTRPKEAGTCVRFN